MSEVIYSSTLKHNRSSSCRHCLLHVIFLGHGSSTLTHRSGHGEEGSKNWPINSSKGVVFLAPPHPWCSFSFLQHRRTYCVLSAQIPLHPPPPTPALASILPGLPGTSPPSPWLLPHPRQWQWPHEQQRCLSEHFFFLIMNKFAREVLNLWD